MVPLAPDTTSRITSKSVSKDGGRTSYRGQLHVGKGASNVKSYVRCDALLLDEESKTDTYPYIEVGEDSATKTHEATVGKIGEDQIISVSEDDLKKEIEQEILRQPDAKEQIIKFYSENSQALASLKAPIFEQKIVEYILENIKIENKEISKKELLKK